MRESNVMWSRQNGTCASASCVHARRRAMHKSMHAQVQTQTSRHMHKRMYSNQCALTSFLLAFGCICNPPSQRARAKSVTGRLSALVPAFEQRYTDIRKHITRRCRCKHASMYKRMCRQRCALTMFVVGDWTDGHPTISTCSHAVCD